MWVSMTGRWDKCAGSEVIVTLHLIRLWSARTQMSSVP